MVSLKLDDATALDIELESAGLMREPWGTALDGPIEMRRRELWRSADGRIMTGIWECDAGRFHADFGGYGELMTAISGEVECIGDDGSHFTLRTGISMTFPRGWTGEWIMPRPLRKVFALWQMD